MIFTLATIAMTQAALQPLQPTQPWALSSQDDGCTIGRAYAGSQTAQFGLQFTMQSRPGFLLVRGPNKLLPNDIGQISLGIDQAPPVTVRYGSFDTPDSGVRLTKLFIDQTTMTQLATARTITIGSKMPPINVSGIKSAIDAAERCTTDKLKSYGVDPKLYLEEKATPVTGTFASMFDARSYPKEARAKKAFGRMVLLLNTGTDGSVTDCKVLTSADETLNAGTCEIAKRGRLRPPLGSDGQPIASYAVLPVRWVRPD